MRYQFWQDRDKQRKLPIVFKTDVRPPRDVYYLHWHKAVEIILVKSGDVFIKNNERTFHGRPNEMYVLHSNHFHSFQMGEKGCEYDCLIIPKELFPYKEFFQAAMPYMTTDADCIRLYNYAHGLYLQQGPFYEETVLGLLIQLYAGLATLGGEQTVGDERAVNATVRQAMHYIENHYSENLTIEDIANAVNISRHHLCHIFKDVAGITPAHYWQRIRCDEARKLLRHGASVAEAADACGFSSYPYFAKVYQKQFGILPSEDKAR